MIESTNPEAVLHEAGATVEAVQPAAPEGSDIALADTFSIRHADRLLYVPAAGYWLYWDGCRWVKENTLAVFDHVSAICRDTARLAEQNKRGDAIRLASAATVAAVERLARADRRHARAADAFDVDPWVLNTPGGVVDLRTGKLRPHRPGEMVTKVTTVTPGGECPNWLAFIQQLVQGDAEMTAYVQRWFGYFLTGETREQKFLMVIGPGGNGKTLLFDVMMHVMGDYAVTAPMETFMATPYPRHETELAGLHGARLVVAQETEAGRMLAEAKIKTLTGGDIISARFMRSNYFKYRPAFKLVMVGNHRPVIRNPDDALRRRLHLLPLTFKPENPDLALSETLKAEAPGILQWALDGCLMWQAQGLEMPKVVKDATADYFADQDPLAQWLAERCERDVRAQAASSDLFGDWATWSETRGEDPGSGKRFSAALEQQQFKKTRSSKGVIFHGLRLRP